MTSFGRSYRMSHCVLLPLLLQLYTVIGSNHFVKVYYDNAVSVNGEVRVPQVFGIT